MKTGVTEEVVMVTRKAYVHVSDVSMCKYV